MAGGAGSGARTSSRWAGGGGGTFCAITETAGSGDFAGSAAAAVTEISVSLVDSRAADDSTVLLVVSDALKLSGSND